VACTDITVWLDPNQLERTERLVLALLPETQGSVDDLVSLVFMAGVAALEKEKGVRPCCATCI